MSDIINGTEVKVGQIWEQRNGAQCKIVELLDPSESCYFIIWESYPDKSLDSGSFNSMGHEFGSDINYSDLLRCISEPDTETDQPKEQSMTQTQSASTVITDLRTNEPQEKQEYSTWGDLPDGTAVLDGFGDLFIVNKCDDVAAFSVDGTDVKNKRATLRGCTQVQIEIQIKKTIRTL